MGTLYLPLAAIVFSLALVPGASAEPPTAKATPVAASKMPAEEAQVDRTTAEERANTARLNAEQAARARTDNIVYEQEVSAAAQQVAHDETEFVEETAVYEAEKARVAAEAAAQRLKWEADVAACKAGDLSRCAQPAGENVPPSRK